VDTAVEGATWVGEKVVEPAVGAVADAGKFVYKNAIRPVGKVINKVGTEVTNTLRKNQSFHNQNNLNLTNAIANKVAKSMKTNIVMTEVPGSNAGLSIFSGNCSTPK